VSSDPLSTDRRDFIGQLATTAVALTTAACAAPAVAAAPVAQAAAGAGSPQARTAWDDSWFGRITASHRAVFDMPTIDDGMGFAHVSGYLRAMKEIHDADAQAVLVIRHAALPLVLNEAMWQKYQMGKLVRRTGLPEGQTMTTNSYVRQVAQMNSRGVIVLACDLATRGYAGRAAEASKGNQAEIYEDFKKNILPGVILQPTGVYAVHRAQEAKCTFIRSSE
jgi:hypothetical protein